jgi:hypothetical protein
MSLLPSSNDDGSDRYDNCLANTMEAVIGAIYLDGGLKHCHNVLASLLFPDNDLCRVWLRVYKDPLKRENPDGDRHMVDSIELLKVYHWLRLISIKCGSLLYLNKLSDTQQPKRKKA